MRAGGYLNGGFAVYICIIVAPKVRISVPGSRREMGGPGGSSREAGCQDSWVLFSPLEGDWDLVA